MVLARESRLKSAATAVIGVTIAPSGVAIVFVVSALSRPCAGTPSSSAAQTRCCLAVSLSRTHAASSLGSAANVALPRCSTAATTVKHASCVRRA